MNAENFIKTMININENCCFILIGETGSGKTQICKNLNIPEIPITIAESYFIDILVKNRNRPFCITSCDIGILDYVDEIEIIPVHVNDNIRFIVVETDKCKPN